MSPNSLQLNKRIEQAQQITTESCHCQLPNSNLPSLSFETEYVNSLKSFGASVLEQSAHSMH